MSSLKRGSPCRHETLFLRKQLALYRERQMKPHRASDATRLGLVLLARWFAWREALTIVQPATLLRWHRKASRLPAELQRLIAAMARSNPTWGEERIAAELLLKLGLRVSPRTVRRCMARETGGGGRGAGSQRWATFVRNNAQAVVACDFCVAVTATFRVLCISVAMEVGSRRLVHINVNRHPTAAWSLQQCREVLAMPHPYRVVLHDRDSIYSPWFDAAVTAMGVRVLRMPVRAPKANAYCERLLGTLHRKGLDFLISFSVDHLRRLLRVWAAHYNRGGPHTRLGPGLPEPPPGLPAPLIKGHRGHRLPRDARVVARPILAGLHHEYDWEKHAA